MKKRGFDDDELSEPAAAPATPRTEPAPHAGKAIGLILASWALPLWIVWSVFDRVEHELSTRRLHTAIAVVSVALVLAGLGVAIRAIDLARKNARMRRRLAYGAVVLGIATPLVWAGELALAFDVFLTRERLDAENAAQADGSTGDASSAPAE